VEPISYTKHEYGVQVPTDQLSVDLDVQRALAPGRVAKINKAFDPALVGELLVFANEKTGEWLIGDGHHRKTVAAMRGLPFLECEVYWGVSKEDQARMFLGRNDRGGMSLVDRDRNMATMRDGLTLAINAACQAAGLRFIGNSRQEVTFGDRAAAVAIISDAQRRAKGKSNGQQHLAQVLLFYTSTFASSIARGERVEPILLKGLSKLFLRKPDLDQDWLVQQIVGVPPQVLVSSAEDERRRIQGQGKSVSLARAMALVLATYYNRWSHKVAGKAITGL